MGALGADTAEAPTRWWKRGWRSPDGVWRAVVPFAASVDAAVIVTGARGHGGARSALLGSVSSGLAYNAERPVLVVPT